METKQQMCKEFIKLIRKNYVKQHGLKRPKFNKLGEHYHFRARQ